MLTAVLLVLVWLVAHVGTCSTGILVHGCHLQATGWESIIWGDESAQLLGRVPQAVLLAHREDANLVVFGTGGSIAADGTLEGDFTLKYLFDNFHRLAAFEAFRSIDIGLLEQKMKTCARLELHSRNTMEELDLCGEMFAQAHIARVILVSSPTHLSRCLRDASWLYAKQKRPFRSHLFACPSDTSYAGCGPLDVAIIEPPHRGDRDQSFDAEPELLLHRLVARFFQLPRSTASVCVCVCARARVRACVRACAKPSTLNPKKPRP